MGVSLLFQQIIIVYLGEPSMVLYIVSFVLQASVSLRQVIHQQMFHYWFRISKSQWCILVEVFWKGYLPTQDVLVDVHWVIIGEGVDSSIHFINQNPQSPPVYRFSMTLILKNLWSQIFRSPTQGESSILDYLCEPKVCQFQVPILRDQ